MCPFSTQNKVIALKATAQMAESADYELAGFLGFDAQFCSTMADFVHWPVDPGIGQISIYGITGYRVSRPGIQN